MFSAKGRVAVAQDGTLTEECIARASCQYDVEVVHSLKLCCMGLSSFGDALSRCHWLARLDVSQNTIASLKGIASLAGSLQHLNAAENQLKEVAGIEACSLLEEVLLEGNQLGSEAALVPLTELPHLRRLFLQRSMPLEGGGETVILDNPVCLGKDVYEGIIQRRFGSVLCVDGRYFRGPSPVDVVGAATIPLPSCDMLGASLSDGGYDDVDERIFANALAESRVTSQVVFSA